MFDFELSVAWVQTTRTFRAKFKMLIQEVSIAWKRDNSGQKKKVLRLLIIDN